MFLIEDRSIGMGEPILIKGGYKYFGASGKYSTKGLVKQEIFNCCHCAKEATQMAVFQGEGHKQIERFCDGCAKIFGPTPDYKLKVVS